MAEKVKLHAIAVVKAQWSFKQAYLMLYEAAMVKNIKHAKPEMRLREPVEWKLTEPRVVMKYYYLLGLLVNQQMRMVAQPQVLR
jgi:hypothetical protein